MLDNDLKIKLKDSYEDYFEWKLDEECIKEDINNLKEKIKFLKYKLELLRDRKPKIQINWNLIKCFFGLHIWEESDHGHMRTCLRCDKVQRRHALPPDGDWSNWEDWD